LVETADPVLQAIIQAAIDATAAQRGWIVSSDPTEMRIVAGAGDGVSALVGQTIELGSGAAGFVIDSGQPIALVPRDDDPRFEHGVTALLGHRPSSVLTVPCANDEDVVGALELIDHVGGGGFTFDDVELATLLAGIAGVALTRDVGGNTVAAPQQLSSELTRLSEVDPNRYAAIATVISALLGRA
jgi:GAF domain-containing protein